MDRIDALIKELREKKRLTQAEISAATGIPQPRISRWESGEVPHAIADAFKLVKFAADNGIDVSGIDRGQE